MSNRINRNNGSASAKHEKANPYQDIHEKSFWRPAVSDRSMFDISDLWNSKFAINKNHKISTFGSCFAQHIGNALKRNGYSWLITEQPPVGMSEKNSRKFGYNVFSARTGNIYTTSLLLQWVKWALEKTKVPSDVWRENDRFYDPFRPNIEPDGFLSEYELINLRNYTIRSFLKCITESDIFVFTLGLTESWFNVAGYEYPMCPGTAAGTYDPSQHFFKNQSYAEVYENLLNAMNIMREVNPELKFILTVSPVPLTATMSGNHVLVATMESKSILRAVSGQLAKCNQFVDYFPSYEIINSPVFRGGFFEPNQRNVSSYGVDFVMNTFLKCINCSMSASVPSVQNLSDDFEEVCEEALLEVYSKREG